MKLVWIAVYAVACVVLFFADQVKDYAADRLKFKDDKKKD